MKSIQEEIADLTMSIPIDSVIEDSLFDSFALELARDQFLSNPALDVPGDMSAWSSWHDIPPTPTQRFRDSLVAAYPERPEVMWFSHRTRSRMPVRNRNYYLDLLGRQIDHYVPKHKEMMYLLLHPSAMDWPSFPASALYYRRVQGEPYDYPITITKRNGPYTINMGQVIDHLAEASESGQPTTILTSTRNLMSIVDTFITHNLSFVLSERSCVVHTGGLKTGRNRVELSSLCGQTLGISPRRIVSAYGATEFFSYLWTPNYLQTTRGPAIRDYNDRHQLVPWMRARTTDSGQLVICDLSSMWNCAVVLTDDFGQVDGRFVTFE